MKNYWLISLFIGSIVLFIFPEPEINFLWYALTAIFFIALTIILYKRVHNSHDKKNKK
jgi:FtsH-binding integral membrane protein